MFNSFGRYAGRIFMPVCRERLGTFEIGAGDRIADDGHDRAGEIGAAEVAGRLIEAGLSPDTAVAVVENASLG
ncbi:MAG: hypothetical protein EOS54_20035, partial [Mesorhizobium sp.]|uniref:hypothetical protein n=1 Tax=Mesorhizobium sp. TaxID=1871066 RepID=UPI000FEA0ECB